MYVYVSSHYLDAAPQVEGHSDWIQITAQEKEDKICKERRGTKGWKVRGREAKNENEEHENN
jgi:hypothetical protein